MKTAQKNPVEVPLLSHIQLHDMKYSLQKLKIIIYSRCRLYNSMEHYATSPTFCGKRSSVCTRIVRKVRGQRLPIWNKHILKNVKEGNL